MKKQDDKEVFATTKFKYRGREVVVAVCQPEKEIDHNTFVCRFFITGGELEYVGKSVGFDSMQALILSLQKIGAFLQDNDDVDNALVEWEGGPMKFPTFNAS